MFQGKLLAIATRPQRQSAVVPAQQAEAVAGRGLRGDHICDKGPGKPRQVTLIESEALAAARADYSLEITHEESRRNLLTDGVPLNHLVGREFRVGEVLLRGVELCEPCTYLSGLLSRDVVAPLLHRGGLCAEILNDGTIQLGDVIQLAEERS